MMVNLYLSFCLVLKKQYLDLAWEKHGPLFGGFIFIVKSKVYRACLN